MSQNRTKNVFLLIVAGAILLSACGPSNSTETPTPVSVDAVYTAAAATISAQLSQTAAVQPSASITPTGTPTGIPSPTLGPSSTTGLIVYPTYALGTATKTATAGPSPTATFGAVGCYNATFVSDVSIPIGTSMTAGKTFTKTWRIMNSGSCEWTYYFTFAYLGSTSDAFYNKTKIRTTVKPGGTIDISLPFTAPASPGTYTGYWRMADDTGKSYFGDLITMKIVVPGATYTPATAFTATATSLATRTPTATVPAAATATATTPAPAPATNTATLPAPDTATSEPTVTETPPGG